MSDANSTSSEGSGEGAGEPYGSGRTEPVPEPIHISEGASECSTEPGSGTELSHAPWSQEERQEHLAHARESARKALPGLIKKVGKLMIFLTVLGCIFLVLAAVILVATINRILGSIPGS